MFFSHKLVSIFLLASVTSGCSGTQRPRGAEPARGFVALEVEPPGVTVYVDEAYSGVVSQWFQSTVPVEPGLVLVELRCEGYISERFDVEVAPGEVVTLQVRMERVLEDGAPDEAALSTPPSVQQRRRD
ncbi:MAG: hypothetical protein AAGI01_14090 [Myxococcota bacterium]